MLELFRAIDAASCNGVVAATTPPPSARICASRQAQLERDVIAALQRGGERFGRGALLRELGFEFGTGLRSARERRCVQMRDLLRGAIAPKDHAAGRRVLPERLEVIGESPRMRALGSRTGIETQQRFHVARTRVAARR
ncbi:MAG: hypothetical protein IPN34_18605 [Planctomycetes bacterium]|nr:hypothetical protein [Planctomycetota bacterium]